MDAWVREKVTISSFLRSWAMRAMVVGIVGKKRTQELLGQTSSTAPRAFCQTSMLNSRLQNFCTQTIKFTGGLGHQYIYVDQTPHWGGGGGHGPPAATRKR